MKNHEGYHDPTAGKAIRRAHSSQKRRADSSKFRRRTRPKVARLAYQRNDGPGVVKCDTPSPTRSVICRGASVPFWQNKQRG